MVSSVNCAVRRGGSPSLALTHLDMSECQGLEDQGLLRLLANCPAISHLYLRKCSGVTGRRNNIPSMTDGSLIDSAQRVGFFNIGSGRVLDKIPGSRSGRSVEKYDRVFPGIFFSFGYLGISGISGYVGYFWVFLGLPIYTWVIF